MTITNRQKAAILGLLVFLIPLDGNAEQVSAPSPASHSDETLAQSDKTQPPSIQAKPLEPATPPIPALAISLGTPVQVQIKSDEKNDWIAPSTLIGVLGVLGGLCGILIQRHWQRQDLERAAARTERDRLQAHVLDSLKWFEGQTQKRNIGISVIEGNWVRFPDLHSTWISILSNQIIYLLTESKQGDAAHECENLRRMFNVLNSADEDEISASQRSAIGLALSRNANGEGLTVPESDREPWLARFPSE